MYFIMDYEPLSSNGMSCLVVSINVFLFSDKGSSFDNVNFLIWSVDPFLISYLLIEMTFICMIILACSFLMVAAVIHPFAEELSYFVLFAIPLMTMAFTGTGSIAAAVGYLMYIDFMNYMGHCNFELVPKWLFDIFPPLKYLMYTPS